MRGMNTYECQEDQAHPRRSAVMGGVVFWLVFSGVMVAVRGVRWDENYEFAQVLLGRVVYPAGHPLRVYVAGFFSGQTRLLEGVMALVPGALVPNGLRNVAWLVLTTVPPFLLATLWTRRIWAAHGAVVVLLAGVHTTFYSNYPVHVWPGLYSNGPIGLGWALLTLYCLAAGRPLAGGVLLGLLPAVHLGQAPPAFAAGGVFVALACLSKMGTVPSESPSAWTVPFLRFHAVITRFFVGLLPGLAAVAALAWLTAPGDGAVTDPVYTAPFAPGQFFHAYMTHYASHRSAPDPSGFAPLVVALPLALSVTLRETQHRRAPVLATVYLAVIAGCVGVTWAAQRVLGPDVPYLLVSWMPYRLLNHAAPLGIAMALAVCATRRVYLPVALALLLLAARPALAAALPGSLYARYCADGAATFFLLLGGGLGRGGGGWLSSWLLPALTLFALGFIHQFGAACLLAGFALSFVPLPGCMPSWVRRGATAAAAVVLVLTVAHETVNRAHLPTPPGLAAARDALAEESAGIVLVPPQQEGFQAQLNHAVMTDMATITWIPYRPALGANLHAMYRELYGIDLVTGPASSLPPWFEAWPRYTPEEWAQRAARHHFSHVLVPAHIALRLPVDVQSGGYTLYRVEGSEP